MVFVPRAVNNAIQKKAIVTNKKYSKYTISSNQKVFLNNVLFK